MWSSFFMLSTVKSFKYYPKTVDMHIFQNLLFQIDKFLLHNKQKKKLLRPL